MPRDQDAIHAHHQWQPNDNFEVRHIGVDSSNLTHVRQAPGGGGDFALGSLLMTADTPGTHRFLFTVVQSRSAVATGVRVGVASEDGRRVCGIHVYDGRPYPAHPSGPTPRYVFLSKRGTGREVEMIVDYAARRVSFVIDGEGIMDSGVTPDALPEAVRPWVMMSFPGDAVTLSGYSFKRPVRRRGGDIVAEGLRPAGRLTAPPSALPQPAYYDESQRAYYDADLSPVPPGGHTYSSEARRTTPHWHHATEAKLRTSRTAQGLGPFGDAVDAMYASGSTARPASSTPPRRPNYAAAPTVAGKAHVDAVRGNRSTPRSKDFGNPMRSPPRPYDAAASGHVAHSYFVHSSSTSPYSDRAEAWGRTRTDEEEWGSSPQPPPPPPPPQQQQYHQQQYHQQPIDYPIQHPDQHEALPEEAHHHHGVSNGVRASEAWAAAPEEPEAVAGEPSDTGHSSGSSAVANETLYPYGNALLPARIRAVPMSTSEQALKSVAAIKAALKAARAEAAQVEAATRNAPSWVGGQGSSSGADDGEAVEWVSRWLGTSPVSHAPDSAEGSDTTPTTAAYINEALASALVAPLRGSRPHGAILARSFLRSLAEEPCRQLAVERLLRESGIVEVIAAEVCAAADQLRITDHAHAMRERVRRLDGEE